MGKLGFLMLLLAACNNDDQPSIPNAGSPRDWTFSKDQVEFFINGVKQSSVSEITVSSQQLHSPSDDVFPWFDTTLRVKGLLSNKKKVTEIKVKGDVERFEGTTILNGIEYDVTGNYTGDPFEHYTKMGIIVYLTDK